MPPRTVGDAPCIHHMVSPDDDVTRRISRLIIIMLIIIITLLRVSRVREREYMMCANRRL